MEALMPVFSFLGSALPVVGSALSVGKSLFGGDSSAPAQAPATTPKPSAISPADYTNQENQYYQQMLAGLGMGTEGGQLPQGIQDAIARQASQL